MKTINVGLIGFGTIGAGVAKILSDNQEIIQKRLGATVRLPRLPTSILKPIEAFKLWKAC